MNYIFPFKIHMYEEISKFTMPTKTVVELILGKSKKYEKYGYYNHRQYRAY